MLRFSNACMVHGQNTVSAAEARGMYGCDVYMRLYWMKPWLGWMMWW